MFTFNYSYGINLLDKIFAAIRIYFYLFVWKLFNIIWYFITNHLHKGVN